MTASNGIRKSILALLAVIFILGASTSILARTITREHPPDCLSGEQMSFQAITSLPAGTYVLTYCYESPPGIVIWCCTKNTSVDGNGRIDEDLSDQVVPVNGDGEVHPLPDIGMWLRVSIGGVDIAPPIKLRTVPRSSSTYSMYGHLTTSMGRVVGTDINDSTAGVFDLMGDEFGSSAMFYPPYSTADSAPGVGIRANDSGGTIFINDANGAPAISLEPDGSADFAGQVKLSSLKFPDNSVQTTAANPIGAAQGFNLAAVSLVKEAMTNITNWGISCPDSGYVLAIATCESYHGHVTGTNTYTTFGLSMDSTATSFLADQDHSWFIPSSIPTGSHYNPITVHRIFKVASGWNNFQLKAKWYSGSGGSTVYDAKISLMFIPAAYGSISSSSNADPFDNVEEANRLGGYGSSPMDSYQTPSSSVSANSDSRVLELEDRVAELESLVQKMLDSEEGSN